MVEYLADDIDFAAYLKQTDHKTLVLPAGAWHQDLIDELHAQADGPRIYLPWEKTMANFHFRPGEVTALCGQNGHGKSLVAGQIAVSLIGQGQRICIASFEMKPKRTIGRAVRQYCGENPHSPAFYGQTDIIETLYTDFFEFVDGKMWVYDQTGSVNTESVLGMVKYCGKELGIDDIFIDNLAKCVHGEDDYNKQKEFIDGLTAIARDTGVHITIVHHLKKPQKETDLPDKHDIKGTGAITDLVDNVFLFWRNKKKEDDFRQFGLNGKLQQEPDQFLLCRKQRNYDGSEDGEPSIALWFHRESAQYLGAAGDEPMFFHNYPHRRT